MIRRNDAKSFQNFKRSVRSKVTALTTIQYIHKFVFDRNIKGPKCSQLKMRNGLIIVASAMNLIP